MLQFSKLGNRFVLIHNIRLLGITLYYYFILYTYSLILSIYTHLMYEIIAYIFDRLKFLFFFLFFLLCYLIFTLYVAIEKATRITIIIIITSFNTIFFIMIIVA